MNINSYKLQFLIFIWIKKHRSIQTLQPLLTNHQNHWTQRNAVHISELHTSGKCKYFWSIFCYTANSDLREKVLCYSGRTVISGRSLIGFMFTPLKACLITSSKERETEAALNLYLQEVVLYLRVPGVRYRSPSGWRWTWTIASLIILPHAPHLPPSQPGKHSAHSWKKCCVISCANRLDSEHKGSQWEWARALLPRSVRAFQRAGWSCAPPSIQMNQGRFLIAGLF